MTRELRPEVSPVFAEQGPKVLPSPPDPVTAAILHGRTVAVEELRLLITRLQLVNDERPARCVGLLSATGGEGKTTLSIGLAAALAGDPDRRVLLIEVDLRKPAIESYLGLPRAPGVGEWLRGLAAPLPVRWVTPPGFALLSGGRVGLDRPDLLGSSRMAALLDAARRSFDFVIVDCPPVAPVTDAVILQDLVDGFLFVVRARHSPREVVLRAASRLKGDRIIGTVFNDQKEILPGYYRYGYRSYGTPPGA
jgi:capsular exopolysaccharide synthesis family protein